MPPPRYAGATTRAPRGVRFAVAHLRALGHCRIAHLAGALNTVAGSERLRAFRDETKRIGLDLPDD
jgi:DNA-binding LacI/PurR family transcriptional regulator